MTLLKTARKRHRLLLRQTENAREEWRYNSEPFNNNVFLFSRRFVVVGTKYKNLLLFTLRRCPA
jgi:hypothetical protein